MNRLFFISFLLISYNSLAFQLSDLYDLENSYKENFKIPLEPKTNKKIKIAVLDTNIDLYHPKYKNVIIVDNKLKSENSHNFYTDIPVEIDPSENLLNKENYYPSHGTHVLGIINTIAKNVEILPLQVVKDNEYGVKKENEIIKRLIIAIDFCIKEKVNIINYSISGGKFSQEEKDALLRAKQAGIFIVVAAGNNNLEIDKETEYYPIQYKLDNIFAIGGLQSDLTNAYGNYSKNLVDTSLPATNIISTMPFDKFGKMTGTSQSAPIFTGLLARLLTKKNYSYKDIRLKIKKSTQVTKTLENINKNKGYLKISHFIDQAKPITNQPKLEDIEKYNAFSFNLK